MYSLTIAEVKYYQWLDRSPGSGSTEADPEHQSDGGPDLHSYHNTFYVQFLQKIKSQTFSCNGLCQPTPSLQHSECYSLFFTHFDPPNPAAVGRITARRDVQKTKTSRKVSQRHPGALGLQRLAAVLCSVQILQPHMIANLDCPILLKLFISLGNNWQKLRLLQRGECSWISGFYSRFST